VFADLTDPNYYATAWAEKAYADGLITNCGTLNGKPKFCPTVLVTRGLGAYVIVRAKNLSMP
jgi:acetyl-CoA carboxylase carboxyltransferase component